MGRAEGEREGILFLTPLTLTLGIFPCFVAVSMRVELDSSPESGKPGDEAKVCSTLLTPH